MLSNEIIDEILFLSNRDKIIDENLIKKIVNVVINQADDITKKKYQGAWFVEISGDSIACVISGLDIIAIDYEKIKKSIESYLKQGGDYFKSNLFVVQTLLHEIEHLKEEYKSSVSSDLERTIIKYGDIDNFKLIATKDILRELGVVQTFTKLISKKGRNELNNKIFDLLSERQDGAYDYDPCEKIAVLDSMKLLLESCYAYPNFVKDYNKLSQTLLEIYFSMFQIGYKEGVLGYNIPIVDFFTIMGNTKYLSKIDTYSKDSKLFLDQSMAKYDSLTRLRLGLPAVEEDFLEVRKKIKSKIRD